jgi:CDP-6-deoxy-D-xylo-4-hexulose-3-dehydrase
MCCSLFVADYSLPFFFTTQYHKSIWYAPNKFEAYGDEEIEAVRACLKDGWLAPGPRTAKFESVVSEYFGKKYGIFCNSGSSANTLALHMAGLKPGDEVITPACTFSTVVAPLCQLHLTPVFCDVEVRTFVPSVDQVMEKVTDKTRAIFVPNLAGSKPDWEALRSRCEQINRRDICLIEDSCDTMTHTVHSDMSIISFYASHVITAGGGGGMVMCNSVEERDVGFSYRDWGRIGNNAEDPSERFGHEVDGISYDFKFLYGVKGYNFKATEMQAAFGLVQMEKLPAFTKKRRALVERYIKNLSDTEYILPVDNGSFNWLAMPMLVPPHWDRKKLLNFIECSGIQTRVFFAGNVTRHPAYREFYSPSDPFPNSDTIMRDCFMLGAHHGLEIEDVDYICSVLKEYDPTKDSTQSTMDPGNCDL